MFTWFNSNWLLISSVDHSYATYQDLIIVLFDCLCFQGTVSHVPLLNAQLSLYRYSTALKLFDDFESLSNIMFIRQMEKTATRWKKQMNLVRLKQIQSESQILNIYITKVTQRWNPHMKLPFNMILNNFMKLTRLHINPSTKIFPLVYLNDFWNNTQATVNPKQ